MHNIKFIQLTKQDKRLCSNLGRNLVKFLPIVSISYIGSTYWKTIYLFFPFFFLKKNFNVDLGYFLP